MTRDTLLSALFAAGVLALLAVLLPSPTLPPRQPDLGLRAVTLPPADRRPLEAYAAIWSKPLFNPVRRMMESAPPLAQGVALRPLSDYRLVGVVIARDAKFALVERSDSKQVVTLHVGDDLDGRRVEDIRIRGVVLGNSEFLSMPRPLRHVRRGRF